MNKFEAQEARLVIMAQPHPQQELIDRLSALAIKGAVDYYAAKQCVEDGDWERARRLIEEAKNE